MSAYEKRGEAVGDRGTDQTQQPAADMRGRARRLLCAAGVVAAAALAACGGGSGSGGSPASQSGNAANADAPVDTTKTTLRIGHPQEPPTWDFIKNDSTAIRQILSLNVVEPLLAQTADGDLAPLLASKYEARNGGREYDFTLREAKFHDGSPLTAADVVYSLEQEQHRPNPSLAYKQVKRIEAVDDHTVRVELKRPSQSFLGGMASDAGLIIKKGTAGSLDKGPVGTGPFRFTSYRQGVGLKLERFDGYWGEKPVLKTVDIQYIADENALVNQLKAGQLDLAVLLGSGRQQLDALKADRRYHVTVAKTAEKTYVALNGKDPAFKNPAVRQAIAHVIDRKALIDTSLPGTATPVCVIASPAEPGFTDECPYDHDPEAAKKLLADAGVHNLTIDIKYIREFGTGTIDLLRSFFQPLGIKVTFVPRDLAKYLDEVLGDTHAFQMTNLSGPQQIDAWRCPGWFLATCDERVDKLLDEADAASSRDEFQELRKQALVQFAKDAYLIPWAASGLPVVANAAVVGVPSSIVPTSSLDLRHMHWTRANG